MPEQLQDFLKRVRDVWSPVREFGRLWLALICLGGFLILIGGPWILGLLTKIFGPAAARPRPVIGLDAILTLPFTIYFWIQERKLAEDNRLCAQCGELYPQTDSACPHCGCANPEETPTNEKPPGDKVASPKP